MRISASERRIMNRRLKDRIPLALRQSCGRLPAFVVYVTTTLTITPEALADLKTGKAEARFVTRAYSKEELRKSSAPANPNIDFNQKLGEEVATLLNLMSQGFKDAAKTQRLNDLQSKEPGKGAFTERAAALQDAPKSPETDVKGVRSFFGLEFQKVARKEAKEKIRAFDKLIKLAKVDLKVGSLWKRSSPPQETSGSVRYGLVVKEIVPNQNVPQMALISDSEEELRYAGHADVHWTIGPVNEAPGRIFEGMSFESPAAKKADERFNLKLPKPDFHTNVSTDPIEDLTKVETSPLPNVRFELLQDEDYYKLSYSATPQGKQVGMEHQFKIPVSGTLALGRRFNDKFQVVETSAYNVLVDKRLPGLSLHQMHIEQRYSADLGTTLPGNQEITLTARGEAKGPVAKEADRPEAYGLTYKREF